MHWLKRNLRKIGILSIVVAVGLLLAWVAWASFSILGMHASVSTAGRVQVVPTANATALTVDVLKQQDDKAQRDNSSFGILLNALGGSIGAALLAIAALVSTMFGFGQWYRNHESEREKQAEGRFQSAVTGLGDEKEGAQIGAAILLRTFLRSGYEQFYTQTFDLAVANLRRRGVSRIVQHQLWNDPQNPDTALPLTTLDQALIIVFKEAFPLARDQEEREPASLDATGVQLDNAYLVKADLKRIWGPQASLRKADLIRANLNGANLNGANLHRADLWGAHLSGAELYEADLDRADLRGAHLSGAFLEGADLSGANLYEADLRWADLMDANLSKADLSGANLFRAYLGGANLGGASLTRANLREADLGGATLSGANLSGADLHGADLHGAEGLTKEQRDEYKARGAWVDEEPASSVSQEPVSSSPPLAPEKVQASSPQETLPTPDADPSNGMSSQIGPDQGTSGEAAKGGEGGRTP